MTAVTASKQQGNFGWKCWSNPSLSSAMWFPRLIMALGASRRWGGAAGSASVGFPLPCFHLLARATRPLHSYLTHTPPLPTPAPSLYGANVNQDLIKGIMKGMTSRRNMVDGKPTSLLDLGYITVGLDECVCPSTHLAASAFCSRPLQAAPKAPLHFLGAPLTPPPPPHTHTITECVHARY